MNRYTKLTKNIPSLYQPTVNTFIKGLLEAWGKGLDDLDIAVDATNKQLFVPTAEGDYLKRLASNVGVVLPTQIGISDADNRSIIKTMSFNPKQVRQTIWNLLETFYTPAEVYANITSSSAETYLLVNGYTIEFLVDGSERVVVTFSTSDFEDITAATSFEVANAINKQALNSRIKAEAYYDYASDKSYVRVFTLSAGSFGSIAVVGGLAQYVLRFPTVRDVGNGITTEWDIAIYHNDIVRMEWTGVGLEPDFNPLQLNDLFILSSVFAVNNIGTFTITDITIGGTVDGITPGLKYTGAYVEFSNPIAVNQTITQTLDSDVVFYYPYKAQITELPVYATEYETSHKEVVIAIPSTSPIVSRNTLGCTHLHPCTSLNNLAVVDVNGIGFEQFEDIIGCDAMYLSAGGTGDFEVGDTITGSTSLQTATVKSVIKNAINDTILAVTGTSGGFSTGETIEAGSPIWANVSPSWLAANDFAYSMVVFGGKLYVGTHNGTAAQVWSYDGSSWVNTSIPWTSRYVTSMAVFAGKLYVGADGPTPGSPAQVWSYDGAIWTNISPGFPAGHVYAVSMAVLGAKLYVGTLSNFAGAAQVWSYDGIIWANVSPAWAAGNVQAESMAVLGTKLYVGSRNTAKAQVWSYDGAVWANVTPGWSAWNMDAKSMTVLGTNLYAGTYNGITGIAQVWSYNGAIWTNTNIPWILGNTYAWSMATLGTKIYVGSYNSTTTIGEVWSYDGVVWANTGAAWAAGNPYAASMAALGTKLYIGTSNVGGAQVWSYNPSGSGITATRGFDLLKSTSGASATISSVLGFNTMLGLDNLSTKPFQVGEAIIGRTVFKTGTVTGSGFRAGEIIVGTSSGASARIGELIFVERGYTIGSLIPISGYFTTGEVITGGTSGSASTMRRIETSSGIIEAINSITEYQSGYVYNSLSPFILLDTYSLLTQAITAGSSYDLLQCDIVSSDFPTSGSFIIDYGLGTQEGPVPFYLTPGETTIRIDPSFVFQYNHAIGSYVRTIKPVESVAVTDQYGLDYPVYITGIDEARLAFQDLVRSLIAAGITIRFIITYPVYRFMDYEFVSILVKQYYIPQAQNVPTPENEYFIYSAWNSGSPIIPGDDVGRGYDQIAPTPAGHIGGGKLKKT